MAQTQAQRIIAELDTSDATKSLRQLRAEVNEYRTALNNLTPGTKEYNIVLDEAAKKQSALNTVTRDLRNSTLNLTDVWRNVGSVASGITAGFTALTSVSALLGRENEALAETLVKIQAGLQLTQAITRLSTGFKSLITLLPKARAAFQAFNTTLLTSPIFIGAAAIIAIVTALSTLTDAFKPVRTEIDKLKESYDELTTSYEKANEELKYEIQLLLARGEITQEEAIRREIEALDNYIKDIQIEINTQQALIDKNNEVIENRKNSVSRYFSIGQTIISGARVQVEEANNLLNAANTNLSDQLKIRKRLVDKFNTAIINNDRLSREKLLSQQNDFDKKEATARQLQANTRVQIQEDARKRELAALNPSERIDALENEIELERIRLGLFQEQEQNGTTEQERADALKNQREIINNIVQLEQQQVAAQNEYSANLDAIAQQQFSATQQEIEQQKELNRLLYGEEQPIDNEEEFKKEIQRLQDLAFQTGITREEQIMWLTKLRQVEQDYYDFQEEEAAKQIARQQAILKNTASFLNASSKLFADNTAASKALGIASATISTYTGATQVLADPTLPFAAKIAAFGKTIATGLAAIKNIVKTKVPGTSDTSTADVDNSTPTIPDYFNDPILETHNNLTGYEEDQINRSQRVYVVESDITNAQNTRVNVVEQTVF